MKIDKSKLFTSEKSGAKYLDCTVFLNDEADSYGQYGMVTQDVTKEQRDSGEKGAILGNVRRVFDKDAPKQDAPKVNSFESEVDDLPF
jgi:hypothetical protein